MIGRSFNDEFRNWDRIIHEVFVTVLFHQCYRPSHQLHLTRRGGHLLVLLQVQDSCVSPWSGSARFSSGRSIKPWSCVHCQRYLHLRAGRETEAPEWRTSFSPALCGALFLQLQRWTDHFNLLCLMGLNNRNLYIEHTLKINIMNLTVYIWHWEFTFDQSSRTLSIGLELYPLNQWIWIIFCRRSKNQFFFFLDLLWL